MPKQEVDGQPLALDLYTTEQEHGRASAELAEPDPDDEEGRKRLKAHTLGLPGSDVKSEEQACQP